MTGIERVTPQLLDLLLVLLDASSRGEELHGYEIKKQAGLSGPSTYRGLDRLEDAHLVEARWEENLPDAAGRPRRRYYRLNPEGMGAARALLGERRPEALHRLGRTPILRPVPRSGFGTRFTALLGLAGGTQ